MPNALKSVFSNESRLFSISNPDVNYTASVWLAMGQTFEFEVVAHSGSHMSVEWRSSDRGEAALETCLSDASSDACRFPFRYEGVLYYGCTNPDEFSLAVIRLQV